MVKGLVPELPTVSVPAPVPGATVPVVVVVTVIGKFTVPLPLSLGMVKLLGVAPVPPVTLSPLPLKVTFPSVAVLAALSARVVPEDRVRLVAGRAIRPGGLFTVRVL